MGKPRRPINRATTPSVYGIVMAGGTGQRFWPLSREHRPKQCLAMIGDGTMLQQACRRLAPLLPARNILVMTRKGIEKTIAGQVPHLPKGNVVAEPCGRDTAACITLAASMLYRKDPGAIMVLVPSDHFFHDARPLVSALKKAADVAARRDVLIIFGIQPTEPATGYGYVQWGNVFGNGTDKNFFHAKRYHEKPNAGTAKHFLESGDYLWNSGMFVWKAAVVLQEIRKCLPDHGKMADALLRAKNPRDFGRVAERMFPRLPKISIDYGVLEKSDRVVVMRCGLNWDDLGSWTALEKYLPSDPQGNTLLGNAVVVEGRKNLVRTDDGHLVAVVGTDNLVVVHTSDATLVCPKEKIPALKQLIVCLQKNPKTKRYI